MYSQACVSAGVRFVLPVRAQPPVIVGTEKVLAGSGWPPVHNGGPTFCGHEPRGERWTPQGAPPGEEPEVHKRQRRLVCF